MVNVTQAFFFFFFAQLNVTSQLRICLGNIGISVGLYSEPAWWTSLYFGRCSTIMKIIHAAEQYDDCQTGHSKQSVPEEQQL